MSEEQVVPASQFRLIATFAPIDGVVQAIFEADDNDQRKLLDAAYRYMTSMPDLVLNKIYITNLNNDRTFNDRHEALRQTLSFWGKDTHAGIELDPVDPDPLGTAQRIMGVMKEGIVVSDPLGALAEAISEGERTPLDYPILLMRGNKMGAQEIAEQRSTRLRGADTGIPQIDEAGFLPKE